MTATDKHPSRLQSANSRDRPVLPLSTEKSMEANPFEQEKLIEEQGGNVVGKLSSRKRNDVTPVDWDIARQIVDDPHALGVYAAPEWAELGEDGKAWAKAITEVALAGIGTPGARWGAEGEPDPHGDRYAGQRSKLALGSMTDDELANAVFMQGADRLDLAALQRGEPSSLALLTAAKDRIRWLSRQVEAAGANPIAGEP